MTDTAVQPTAPAPVKRAVLCLWLSWIVGILRVPVLFQDPALRAKVEESLAMAQAMQQTSEEDMEAVRSLAVAIFYGAAGFSIVVWLGITALVLSKVKKGRNWARILCLVWGALCAIGLFRLTSVSLSNGLTVASLALGYYALYLLFSEPGASWFSKQPADAAPDAKW